MIRPLCEDGVHDEGRAKCEQRCVQTSWCVRPWSSSSFLLRAAFGRRCAATGSRGRKVYRGTTQILVYNDPRASIFLHEPRWKNRDTDDPGVASLAQRVSLHLGLFPAARYRNGASAFPAQINRSQVATLAEELIAVASVRGPPLISHCSSGYQNERHRGAGEDSPRPNNT